jgi:putative glycosyltransferase (TIGR04348 family)
MDSSAAPKLVLVTPYRADANNGNWRTAARWARRLAPAYRVILQAADAPIGRAADAVAMIALHARRSRAAVGAWKRERPDAALLVTLTGTDLYRDLPAGDADAQASCSDADRLIVLQADAVDHVPQAFRRNVDVVYQSAQPLRPWPSKRTDRLDVLLVAHLREEKDPRTVFEAWRRLPADVEATLTIIGDALDPSLGDAARRLADADARVQWLGARPHAWTRQAIRRAHALVVPSRMEGGANVVVEAVTAGTPVIASRMSGNLGMLGDDYAGYFPVGDAGALAALLTRASADRGFLDALNDQCRARSVLFTPEAERQSLHAAVRRARESAAGRIFSDVNEGNRYR